MVIGESLIVLLDIGPSMQPHVEVIRKSLASLALRKLVSHKNDAIGLVCFGSRETRNVLSTEVGGYANIQVVREIQVLDTDVATILDQVPLGGASADFLDAVVVGLDMFKKQVQTTRNGHKRLFLITDAESSLREPHQMTLQEQVDLIGDKLVENKLKFDVLKVSKDVDPISKTTHQQNEHFMRTFVMRTEGDMQEVSTHASIMAAIKPRVSPTTLYRGDFELTPEMKLKVWVYKKVSQERIPTLKKFSDKAPADDPYATREVKMDVEYKSTLDPSITFPPEQRIKAYKYGVNNIPLDPKVVDAVKLVTEKGLKLIGFVTPEEVPRHYYMKDTKLFIPEPGNIKSTMAMSALVRAMKNTGMLGLARCIWRKGQANVIIGVLTPNPATDDTMEDTFYFNEVPFAEDIREFPFNPFSNRPASQRPSASQESAAENLVQMLDLSPSPREEALQPEKTCNPILMRFYSFLHARLLDSEAPVPAVPEALRKTMELDPTLVESQAHWALKQFSSEFTLRAKVQGNGEHKFWREGLADAPGNDRALQNDDMAVEGSNQSEITFESLAVKKVDEVGIAHPVEDFETLLARRDGDQFVPIAIRGMKKVIDDMLESAYKGNTYEKALSCLIALRSGCVKEEEPAEFNDFLRQLVIKCRGRRLSDFWDKVASRSITLIISDEVSASNVSADEAKAFLAGPGPGKGVLSTDNGPDEEVDEMDALLDEAM